MTTCADGQPGEPSPPPNTKWLSAGTVIPLEPGSVERAIEAFAPREASWQDRRMAGWQDSVVVVTGGSTGIGRATVLDLVRRGARVVAVARNPERLDALRAEADDRCEPLVLDVTDAEAAASALRDVEGRLGRIDVLVNNAGTGAYGPVERTAASAFDSVMRTNFLGAVHCTLPVVSGMLERGRGHVVNVSSPMAFAPAPGQAAYAASKAALDAFSETLLAEVGDRGVRVSVVYPGYVRTPLTEGVYRDQPLPPKSVRMSPERVAAGIVRAVESERTRVFLPWFTGLGVVVKAIAPGFMRRQTARTQPLTVR